MRSGSKEPVETAKSRRPIAARSSPWAQHLARLAVEQGITPNAISAASMGAALLAGLFLWWAGSADGWLARSTLLVLAAAMVGARLVANLIDGMVAVEGGKASASGALWNEAPDRVSDLLILVGAGAGVAAAGAGPDWLGWLAASAALVTAYVRELGARVGAGMDFGGPMAKPHRMAVVIGGCAGGLVEGLWGGDFGVMALGLWLVAIGSLITAGLRLSRAAAHLARAGAPDASAQAGVAPPGAPDGKDAGEGRVDSSSSSSDGDGGGD
jgi:phosphatidylglycerophosphate synthase